MLSGTGVVVVARASTRTEPLHTEGHVGKRLPAHASATGKVLLAGLSPERLATYFARATLEPLTPRTVTDRATLMAQIDATRRDGYATSEEEMAPGAVSLAVPVHDGSGHVVAGLGICAHVHEANAAQLVSRHLETLREASQAISAEVARVTGLALSAQA